jgi:hypothetical protein
MRKTEIQTIRRVTLSRSTLFFLFPFLFSLLLSCRSVPTQFDTTLLESGSLPLQPGGAAYIVIDAGSSRPVLERLNFSFANNKQFRQMLDRTHSAVAAVYYKGNKQRYQLIAWGRYPVSRANMAFSFSSNWKKQCSAINGEAYWHSAQDRLSVALGPQEALVSIATGPSPVDPFSVSGIDVPVKTQIPEGFGAFSRGAALACWINSPASLLNQKLSEMDIPLELPAEKLFLSLFPADEGRAGGERHYTAVIRIEVPSETQARALATILTIGRGFFSPGAGSGGAFGLADLLFSNAPVQDGNSLVITTDALSAGEISLLFDIFSL